MKRLLIFMLVAVLLLSGCTDQKEAGQTAPMLSQVTVHHAGEKVGDMFQEKTEFFSQPVTEPAPPTEVADLQLDRTLEEKNFGNTEHVEENREQPTENPSRKENPVAIPDRGEYRETEAPATTEPDREKETSSQTEPPDQALLATEPEETLPSQPVEETQPELEFDISYWITFAQNYAQRIGLNLDATAVDCWDNPITAGAHCAYLERDITNRLNRYNADEDITDVWIWAIDCSDGSYDLYIGYA